MGAAFLPDGTAPPRLHLHQAGETLGTLRAYPARQPPAAAAGQGVKL
jgi:hypothetical protein